MKSTIDHQYNILIESRLTRLETVIENINENNKNIINALTRLDGKVDKHFIWTIGIIMTMFGGAIISNILRSLHWIN